ncbi:hypothetical protein ACFXPA_45115 [Amycolatopsis sp. NPDC059090]|uniref:restriction system modified-DNA reader domain-containing protein n=1 Tax=Amycolatopsis sp. NPDC059090 TaxID=3346723 RepID=UPI0036722C97
MTAERDIPEPSDTAPGAAVDARQTTPAPDPATATAGASQPHDEASIREWRGLPPDTIILAPAFAAPPLRCPDDGWGMLVAAVDTDPDPDPDRAGDVALFAGRWIPGQPRARSHDGDLVLRMARPAASSCPRPRDDAADIEMLLACHGNWHRVGRWRGVDDRWPRIVAPTAAAVTSLHADTADAQCLAGRAAEPSPTMLRPDRHGICELLAAGAVQAGDQVVWHRRNHGVRHTARIREDGTLQLPDGRTYATPSGPTAALGGYPRNGWKVFRVSDGRTLDEVRAELRARRGH